MTHANAALTPQHHVRIARLVHGGWPPSRAAEFSKRFVPVSYRVIPPVTRARVPRGSSQRTLLPDVAPSR